MAWRLMSWDLADYLLVVGSVPSVPHCLAKCQLKVFLMMF